MMLIKPQHFCPAARKLGGFSYGLLPSRCPQLLFQSIISYGHSASSHPACLQSVCVHIDEDMIRIVVVVQAMSWVMGGVDPLHRLVDRACVYTAGFGLNFFWGKVGWSEPNGKDKYNTFSSVSTFRRLKRRRQVSPLFSLHSLLRTLPHFVEDVWIKHGISRKSDQNKYSIHS